MTISRAGININIPNTTSSTGSMSVDSESKNLQNQLTSEKQRLKQVSSDTEMSTEEKEKERRKIQQQIAELNRKLRMERMEQKKEVEQAEEEQEKRSVQREEILEEIAPPKEQDETEQAKKAEKPDAEMPDKDISVKELQIMFAADSMLQQERVRESADRAKEGRENVLEAEIQLDGLYGSDVEAKKEELASLRKENAFQLEIQEKRLEQVPRGMKTGGKVIIRENKKSS